MRDALGSFASGWLATIIAIVLPLAGLLITIAAIADDRPEDAKRAGAGTVLGIFVYLLIFA